MGIIQVSDFGERNGVRTYRVHGDKTDLEELIDAMHKLETSFEDSPVIDYLRKGSWTMLLQIKIPVGVGGDR
jgi:hypothetical protein